MIHAEIKFMEKILLNVQSIMPCNYMKPTLKKSNNTESTHKWVNNYVFTTTFTPTNNATLNFSKPGDPHLGLL